LDKITEFRKSVIDLGKSNAINNNPVKVKIEIHIRVNLLKEILINIQIKLLFFVKNFDLKGLILSNLNHENNENNFLVMRDKNG
jgi:hypothetical protein